MIGRFHVPDASIRAFTCSAVPAPPASAERSSSGYWVPVSSPWRLSVVRVGERSPLLEQVLVAEHRRVEGHVNRFRAAHPLSRASGTSGSERAAEEPMSASAHGGRRAGPPHAQKQRPARTATSVCCPATAEPFPLSCSFMATAPLAVCPFSGRRVATRSPGRKTVATLAMGRRAHDRRCPAPAVYVT